MPNPMVGNERLEVVKVREKLPESLLRVKEHLGDTYICIKREYIPQVLQLLKEDPELQYHYFSECLGADYSKWNHERDVPGRFEVIYNLMSLRYYSRIFVKLGVDEGQKVPTVKHIFSGADYPEREIWDMFGVEFEGNDQKERFIMPEDWVGYPLRKEYPLGGEEVVFADGTKGPAIEDIPAPYAGESFEGKTGTKEIDGR